MTVIKKAAAASVRLLSFFDAVLSTPTLPAALARATDPQTSHEAAAEVDVAKLEAVVVARLGHGPATTSELSERTGIPRDSLSPRMPSLRRYGLIVDSGQRRRPVDGNGNSYGRHQIVWRLREDGEPEAPRKKTTAERLADAEARIERVHLAVSEPLYLTGRELADRIRHIVKGEA